MTRETVAGESPRCSARAFKLTDRAAAFRCEVEAVTVFDRGMGCSVRVVWHTELDRASREVLSQSVPASCAELNRQRAS
jgi:hypothetical protein